MSGPIKDFYVSDNLGRRFYFYTEKTPSGAPLASTFSNAAGHLNKGYVWHFSLEEKPGKRTDLVCPGSKPFATKKRAPTPDALSSLASLIMPSA